MQKHRRQFRNAIIGILGGTLLAYLGLFWLGYYEDPFHLFSADNRPPNNPKRLSLQNILASYSYVTKAKQIIDLKPDRIILGSSVENYGMRIKGSFLNYIDPAPEKSDKLRSIFPRNIELYDAAIGGGGLDEAYQYLQHAYLNNPDLNEVVLGLEWREFAASLPNQEMKNLPTVSALDRTSTPVGFLLQYTISKLAMDYALELFGARGQQYNAASRIARNLLMPEDYIFPKIDKIIAHHLMIQPPDSNAVHASVSREPLFANSGEALNVAVSLWMANSLHKNYLESGDAVLLRPDMLERLKSIVGFCREKNIRAGREARPSGYLDFSEATRRVMRPSSGSGFKLDVEAVAVFVRPSTADACPESFAAFAVADMVGNVARCFGSGLVVGGISHGKSPF
jgi:hypothetical protein